MTDAELDRLVRAAMPPVDARGPRLDLWPAITERIDARPRWAWLDIGLAAALVGVFVVFPEWLSMLLYHF